MPPEARRFSRFRDSADSTGPGLSRVPAKGLCLSAFVILRERGDPTRVVLGKMNPRAPWDHLAAVDAGRMEGLRDSWVLPASQLLLYEPPGDAAQRVVRELLDLPPIDLTGPRVESEAYGRTDISGEDLHWDFEFLYEGELEAQLLRPNPNWSELRFLRVSDVPRATIGRGHADILAHVGLTAK